MELQKAFAGFEYSWDTTRCQRATLAAEAVVPDCARFDLPRCALPNFVDGVPLAYPASAYDLIVILTKAGHDLHVEKSLQPGAGPGQSGAGKVRSGSRMGSAGSAWRFEDREVQPIGLTGPVYFFAPQTGAMLAVRQFQSAAPATVRDAIVQAIAEQERPSDAPP